VPSCAVTGTRVPTSTGTHDTAVRVAHTGGVTVWQRLLEPRMLRAVAYAVAVLGALLAIVASLTEVTPTASTWVWPIIPLTAVLSLPSRRWRATVLGVGAGIVAVWCAGESSFLWPAVAALVFASITEDQRVPPRVGWIAGTIGAVCSLIVVPNAGVAAFAGVVIGGAAATLLRSQLRTAELTVEAEELRGQAAWLEQRTVLARELHDVVGHQVTAIVVTAEAGQVGDPATALRTIAELGRTALGELDGLVVHLRDPAAPLSVSAPPRLLDIDELLAEPLRRQGVAVSVRVEEDLGLDDADVLTLYRIAQEALTNVARHASARHVWVDLGRHGGELRLRISDDGVGITDAPRRGSGLLGIEERVAARGGSWALEGRPGGGTMLGVVLPERR